ncbi:MAG: hypothetical protein ACTHNP_06760 [Solirubrobacterales bacterium]
MADALILEFEGYGLDEYEKVNSILGVDMQSGEGDWPEGLLLHSASIKPGGFLIYEVWASQEDQERFMNERLGRALQEGGVEGPPARSDWLDLQSHHNLES